jgi:hypothetical protein
LRLAIVEGYAMHAGYVKTSISAVALILLVTHIFRPEWQIDTITLGLLAVAVLPWFSAIIESAELPGGWKVKFREIETVQKHQQTEIESLKFLLSHFLTGHELTHPQKLERGSPFPFIRAPETSFFVAELRRLRALGMVLGRPGKGIRSLLTEGGDVKEHFEITERGREYLKLRQEIDAERSESD